MSKEAMKLALDALVYASSHCDTYDAITALREALAEQPAQQEPESECNPQDLCAGCRCKYAAQPAQQEPVEWLELLREARDNCKASIVEDGISASRKEYRIDLEARLTAALNTSPPAQRTWVGLTAQETASIAECVYGSAHHDDITFATEIQTKLKERNQ